MRNLKLTIEYDGTNYCGWQIQRHPRASLHRPQGRTIQETIEKVLRRILQEEIRLVGSGRTDAGVHARAQVANFKTSSGMPLIKIQRALNGLLPQDIVIVDIEEVGQDFHSRFDAKSKLYRYTILNRHYPSVSLRNRAYFYPYPLNLGLMREEARVLLGRHNLKSFQSSDKKERSSTRTIKKIAVTRNRDLVYIDIEADGFLYNMVRNIVGTLIEIGRGRFPAGSMRLFLRLKDRKSTGPTAPACGLCLEEVKY